MAIKRGPCDYIAILRPYKRFSGLNINNAGQYWQRRIASSLPCVVPRDSECPKS